MDEEDRIRQFQTDAENQEVFRYEPPEVNRKKRSKLLIRGAAILTLAVFLFYSLPDFSFFVSDKFNFIRENGVLVKDDIVIKCRPAVVYVEAIDAGGNIKQGTGFNISSEGVIITNKHVIKDAAIVNVKFANGSSYYSRDLSYDTENDIAIIRLKGSNLPMLNINTEADSKKGDTVTVIGNPLGYVRISQRGSIGDYMHTADNTAPVFTIDIKVNPGSSGSPVINSKAEVVGVVFASMENKSLALSARYINIKGIEGIGR